MNDGEDEFSTYKNLTVKEELQNLDNEDLMAERPPKDSNITQNIPIRNSKQRMRRREKKKGDEIIWKEHGHLPRSSTKRKYIGNSKHAYYPTSI